MIKVHRTIESTNKYSVFTLLAGSLLVHSYLYNVDINPFHIEFLFLGVIVQSTSLLWLLSPILTGSKRSISPTLFMSCILMFSFSMSYATVTRFGTVYGSDVQREFKDALATIANERWDPYLTPPGYISPAYKYTNVLSITIFPLILKEVTGLGVEQLFVFFMPAIIALLPLFAFVTIRRFLGESPVIFLSIALMPQIFFFYVLRDLYRSALIMPSLLLMMYCLSRGTRKDTMLGLLFSLSVASGHYTLVYFSNILLLSSILAPPIFRRLFPKSDKVARIKVGTISSGQFIACFLVQILWLAYISAPVFFYHVQQGFNLVNQLLSFVYERRAETGYVLTSPRGPIITMWFDMQFVLMGVGGLLGMIECARGRIKCRSEFTWILTCCSLIGFTLLVSISTLSIYLQVERIISYYLLWLSSAMAISLIRIRRSRFKAFTLVFLLLILPMNMLLPDHSNDMMYHPANHLAPRIQADYYGRIVTAEGKGVAKWMESYLAVSPEFMKGALPGYHREFVTMDTIGWQVSNWNTLSTQTFLRVSYPTFRILGSVPSTYAPNLLLHNLFVKDGMWISTIELADVGYAVTGEFRLYPAVKITSTSLFEESGNSIVYSNGVFTLLHRS